MFGKGVGERERERVWRGGNGWWNCFLHRFCVCMSVLMHRSVPVSLQRGV